MQKKKKKANIFYTENILFVSVTFNKFIEPESYTPKPYTFSS